MAITTLAWALVGWLSAWFAVNHWQGWFGGCAMWIISAVLLPIGGALGAGFFIEQAGGNVKDSVVNILAMGLAVNFLWYPFLFFWLRAKRNKQT